MMTIKYVNSNGKSVNLNRSHYKMLVSDILDYEWEYVTNGDRIIGFKKSIKEKTLSIDILASSQKTARQWEKELFEIFEVDVINGIPGKLYINDWYLPCFIFKSTKTGWETDRLIMDEVKLVCDQVLWIYEDKVEISELTEDEEDNEGKIYPYQYSFRYDKSVAVEKISSKHYAESDFRLVAYGPTAEVSVKIAGHTYKVSHVVEDGDYMVIDSRKSQPLGEQIYIVKANGETENVFNDRDTNGEIFKRIPPGNVSVSYNREYAIELTVFRERSEPEWS